MFKKLIPIIALTFSTGVWSDMKPLLNYLEDLGDNVDEGSFLYVHYRCLGLLGMVANVTDKSTQENSQNIAKITEERN